MLPTPALSSGSTSRRGALHYNAKNGRSRSFDYRAALQSLSRRSRLTNLAVLLLTTFCFVSFVYNLAFIFSSSTHPYASSMGFVGYGPPGSILATIRRDETLERLSHLIVVPGHAIWLGSKSDDVLDEELWTLEDYQRGGGRVAAFVNHIKHGVLLASEDKNSLLVFSGGQTRLQSTTTEAESYMRLAQSMDLFRTAATPGVNTPFFRATTETYALDSYQNILFSIARFHEVTGRYPSQITVVGYEMKRRRFEELHRAAIRFPPHSFEYIGLEPVAANDEAIKAREGELQNGYLPYAVDVYGCHGFLLSKRRGRNPFIRFHSYHASAPELRGLLEWCPDDPKKTFQGPLPWDAFG